MASSFPDNFDFPQFPPPPNDPFNPRPHPLPPPVSPDRHHPNLVVIAVVLGCVLVVVGALVLCMWWFIKRHMHKERKVIHERKDIEVDEHLRVQEMIVPGCCGPKKVLVSVKEDVRVHEDVHKNEVDVVGNGLRGNPKEGSSSQQLSISEQQV